MTNATSFWGAAHATPATCATTASTGALTCNGDGNGQILPSAGSNESYRFWQQLANAGLIEGTFSGITQGSTSYSSTAANSPRGKLGNSLWWIWYSGSLTSYTVVFDGAYNNALQFGAPEVDAHPVNSIFKPEELWNIDTKIDDGKPALGKVVARAQTGLSTCTTTAANNPTTLTADYLLSATGITCAVYFRNLF